MGADQDGYSVSAKSGHFTRFVDSCRRSRAFGARLFRSHRLSINENATRRQNSFLNDLVNRSACFFRLKIKNRTLHVIQTLISRTYNQHTESTMKITTRKAVHVWFVCLERSSCRVNGVLLWGLGSALSSDCIG